MLYAFLAGECRAYPDELANIAGAFGQHNSDPNGLGLAWTHWAMEMAAHARSFGTWGRRNSPQTDGVSMTQMAAAGDGNPDGNDQRKPGALER